MRVIVCAANRITRNDGTIDIICSPRHCDSIYKMRFLQMSKEEKLLWEKAEQGFVDQHGIFLNREEARLIAINNNQIRRSCGGDDIKLYSENLY